MIMQNNHRPTLNDRIPVDEKLAKKLVAFKRECGTGEFNKQVEKEFGIKWRKARYVLQIHDQLKKSGVTWGSVERLGWTKLKELAHILTKKNVAEILDKLADANTDTVKKFVRGYNGNSRQVVRPIKTLVLKMSPTQHKAVIRTLEHIKKERTLDSKDDALAALCESPATQTKTSTKELALALALHSVRNTAIERIHEGIPASKKGDYSDVKVVTPSGQIPWNEVSRITQDEMRELMKEVVNKIYTVLLRQNDPAFVERMLKSTKQSTYMWDAPQNLTEWFTGKWDNKTR